MEEESEEEDHQEDEEGLEGSGWQLLNCVESGGTLSSLFTILSLFTEDVKLRYEEDEQEEEEEEHRTRDGDVNDFNLDGIGIGGLGNRGGGAKGMRSSDTEDADDERGEIGSGGKGQGQATKRRSFGGTGLTSTEGGEDSTIPEEEEEDLEDGEGRTRTARATPSFAKVTTQTPSAYPFPPMNQRNSSRREVPRNKRRKSTKMGGPSGGGEATSSKQFETTLARATVDTTLAVIPAEAFRRLTKKFPNAAAYVSFSLYFLSSTRPFDC